ncbi:MAG: hypothetical protein WA793_11190 [Sphingorhabdus sp.]|uniref:hypothetical protein n=1 Tax=Sphingorhabdus sp. TaxID=1902408 RepID=UPI003C8432EA
MFLAIDRCLKRMLCLRDIPQTRIGTPKVDQPGRIIVWNAFSRLEQRKAVSLSLANSASKPRAPRSYPISAAGVPADVLDAANDAIANAIGTIFMSTLLSAIVMFVTLSLQ